MESLSHTEQLSLFMLLGGQRVRRAHIIRLQRLNPVTDFYVQRNKNINTSLGELVMTETESMSATLGYICLALLSNYKGCGF